MYASTLVESGPSYLMSGMSAKNEPAVTFCFFDLGDGGIGTGRENASENSPSGVNLVSRGHLAPRNQPALDPC